MAKYRARWFPRVDSYFGAQYLVFEREKEIFSALKEFYGGVTGNCPCKY